MNATAKEERDADDDVIAILGDRAPDWRTATLLARDELGHIVAYGSLNRDAIFIGANPLDVASLSPSPLPASE